MGLPLVEIGAAVGAFALGWQVGKRRCGRGRQAAIADERRAAQAIDEVVLAVSRGGHAEAVLMSLARQACEILHVEKALVVMRDEADPRTCVVMAGHGVPSDFVGRRFGIDEGIFGAVIMSGKATVVSDYREFHRALTDEVGRDVRAGAAVPIRLGGAVEGALSAGTVVAGRAFGARELETLSRLAELGGVALEQAAIREQLEAAVESGVEAMAAAVDIRDSY